MFFASMVNKQSSNFDTLKVKSSILLSSVVVFLSVLLNLI
jgi:hypothetical protein